MNRFCFILIFFLVGSVHFASAQGDNNASQPEKKDTIQSITKKKLAPDTLKYINIGKIEGRKAMLRSAILPGLGQLTSKVNVWNVSKVALFYGGTVMLVLSYIDNHQKYNEFLTELQYRSNHNDVPSPSSIYARYPTANLTVAKDIYKRNSQLVLGSLAGIYILNIIDAYVSARLKYFDIDKNLSMKISPTIIKDTGIYNAYHNNIPAIKISFKL